MVALSMADGWARVTGKPQAVIVHVDVGTQALGCGLHNASAGQCPVFIFAGLCPVTDDGRLAGSRTEYQHWIQDAPDQKAIVRQYCRYVGDISKGQAVKQVVSRALQFAESDPKGPVYVTGAREVMAEEIEPYAIDTAKMRPIISAALPDNAVREISEALLKAKKPLVITGRSGRNHSTPLILVAIADLVPGLRVFDTAGSDMCFPSTHPASVGFRYSVDNATTDADVILVLECDVPWIPSRNPPLHDARIYQVAVDPLNSMMLNSSFQADKRWKVSSDVALRQINSLIGRMCYGRKNVNPALHVKQRQQLEEAHNTKNAVIKRLAAPLPGNKLTAHHVGALIKISVPNDTVFVIEAVTSAVAISDQLQLSLPGTWINCGGAGLGWSGGAALGVKLAYETEGRPKFVCAIVGDGTFLYSLPASVYWIAAKYNIPVLTVVLNNGGQLLKDHSSNSSIGTDLEIYMIGWNAPRKSLELVHPDGLAVKAQDVDLNISIAPAPDYGGIAKAATGHSMKGMDQSIYGCKASTMDELEGALKQGVEAVKEGKSAVVEAILIKDSK